MAHTYHHGRVRGLKPMPKPRGPAPEWPEAEDNDPYFVRPLHPKSSAHEVVSREADHGLHDPVFCITNTKARAIAVCDLLNGGFVDHACRLAGLPSPEYDEVNHTDQEEN